MKTKFLLILALLAFQLSLSFGQTSAVPGTISYQGRVYKTDGTLLGTGTPVNRTVIFRIWDSSSATTQANLLYSESQTVTISEGEFSVLVGNGIANTTQTYSYSETSKHSSASPAVNLADVFNGATRYLSVTVANAATISVSDAEISPRQQIVSSAFAFRSKFAETLGTSTSGSSLQVLDNGNVGVGNASPPSILTVTGASSSTSSPQLLLTATDTTERLRLGVNDTGTGTGFIQAWKEGSGAQNLTLNSGGGNVGIGTDAPTNPLSVTGDANFSGNVGIGTNAPTNKLTLATTTLNDGIKFTSNSGPWNLLSPGWTQDAYNGITKENDSGIIFSGGSQNTGGFVLAPWATGTSGLRIDGTGKVGIGTNAPTNPLSVTGDANFNGNVGIGTTTSELRLHALAPAGTNVVARFDSGSLGSNSAAFADFAGGRAYVGYNGSKIILGSPSGTPAKDLVLAPGSVARYSIQSSNGTHTWSSGAGAGSPEMSLNSEGNLGIGTETPTMKLAIADGASDNTRYGSLQITREANNHTAAHMAFVRAGETAMGLGYQQNSNWFGFGIGTTGNFQPNALKTDGTKVLIGTGTANALLNVGSATNLVASYGRLTTNGANGDNNNYQDADFSIYADGHVMAMQFDINSDKRIKTALHHSDSHADLGTLLGIEITDYKYIDTVGNGNGLHKKVIAQQVETVFPQAVKKSVNTVPDIYQTSTEENGWVQLATDLKPGEHVRLIGENEESTEEVLEVRDGAFRTSYKPADGKLFVYGRQVPDFRSVDYDAIAMLNVSATQQINKELDAVKIENAELKNQLAALVAEVAKADQAHEDRLLAIEQRLFGATKGTFPISSQNKGAAQ